MLVYQPIFSVLKLKKDKVLNILLVGNQNGYRYSKLIALHGAFLPDVEYFRNKIGTQFKITPLVIEQNNYVTKTYIAKFMI